VAFGLQFLIGAWIQRQFPEENDWYEERSKQQIEDFEFEFYPKPEQ